MEKRYFDKETFGKKLKDFKELPKLIEKTLKLTDNKIQTYIWAYLMKQKDLCF